ncbi:MAG: hypothetical protein GXO70_07485 [Acidobacteria bacterium]|nr:hypothetical protein [Acidobacteriota bacterium]
MNRKQIFTFSLAILALLLTPQISAAESASTLAPLKPLSGKWVGRGDGVDGPTVVKHIFSFVLGKAHFLNKETERFKPKDGEKVGQLRNSAGFFSIGPAKKSILYREFTSDGQVHRYKLITVSKDGLTLTFQSEQEEENQGGKQTRLTFQLTKRNALQIIRSQSTDGKNFKQIKSIQLKRIKQKKKYRIRNKLKNQNDSVNLR